VNDPLGVFAQQHRERILTRVHRGVHGRYLRLERVEFPRGKLDIELIGDSTLIAQVYDAQRFTQHAIGAAQNARANLQTAQIDIASNDVCNEGGDDRGTRRGRGLRIVARRLELTPVLAEYVELPHRVESRDRIDVLQAAAVIRRAKTLFSPAARQVRSGAASGRRRRVNFG